MSDPVLNPYTEQIDGKDQHAGYLFWCPGCKQVHCVRTVALRPLGPTWAFDGNNEKPTFSPSLRISDQNGTRCHLFVRAGQLQYCGDSPHELAGKTIPMVPFQWCDEETESPAGVSARAWKLAGEIRRPTDPFSGPFSAEENDAMDRKEREEDARKIDKEVRVWR